MTTPQTKTLATLLAASAVAGGVLAPGASAQRQDLRSPDARDAAPPLVVETRQDCARPTPAPAPGATPRSATGQDLRSPDARDGAEGYAPVLSEQPAPITAPSSEGFDWVSAAIGGAALGGLVILLFARSGSRRGHGGRPVHT